MSLFGDADETIPSRKKDSSTLFGDEQTQAKAGGGSMFADDTADAGDDSPWNFTPRKSNGRKDVGSAVKTLLSNANIPELYIDTWDELASGRSTVGAADARALLRRCNLGNAEDKIWSIVTAGSKIAELSRGEFNVLLALVGLAQEGEELSLDSVDERRNSLPTPAIPVAPKAQPETPARNGTKEHGRQVFGSSFAENDPWGSSALSKGRDDNSVAGGHATHRTTSTFTTAASEPIDESTTGGFGSRSGASNQDGSWGGDSFTPAGSKSFGTPGDTSGGFGGDDEGGPARRPAPAQRVLTSKGQDEIITVNLLDEKEGMFMFQHRNYEVASVRRNSKVIRRYSDFVWLLDCLHKRYPFRQLPLLPPKRVAINGNHIASDTLFVEKRRRGLVRFANALIRHPILREEQLVVMFLTVPTVSADVDLVRNYMY